MNRRGLLLGLSAFLAAPAIIRVATLMPIKVERRMTPWQLLEEQIERAMAKARHDIDTAYFGSYAYTGPVDLPPIDDSRYQHHPYIGSMQSFIVATGA